MPTPKFSFIKDEPLDQDGENFFNFYHSVIAPALRKILENESAPHTIGLFGSWGTGKSTIIKMLVKDKGLKSPIFVFDAWKYQNDALRRTFLIELAKFIRKEGVEIDDAILKPLFIATATSITSESKLEQKNLDKRSKVIRWLKAKMLPLTVGASFAAWLVTYLLYRNTDVMMTLRSMLGAIWAVSGAALVFKPLIEGIVKQALEKFFSSLKDQVEQRTQTEYQERFNSPEQFEEKFQEIIEKIDKKIIIVFDNIDRVQGDVAISMLATIKTFMEPAKKGNLVFIIPCDAEAIEHQITEYYKSRTEDSDQDNFTPTDYLRKVFNLVVWVPEFVSTDLEEYTKRCLLVTGEISSLLCNEDVILVINSAFSKNPREIIQFVNNLTALVVTAQETEVASTINDNVAYLAKVLVLKQRFPKAYAKLKESWYSPEDIINSFETSEAGLHDFMNLTNRITVRDAEPFIYFKNPDSSRGISNSDDFKAALVKADGKLALEASKKEDPNAIVEFIVDLLIKHKSQEKTLQNIFVSHFELLEELNITPTQKRYYENLAKILDGQLWQHYRELPIDHIFNRLLSSKSLTSKTRAAIVERYILVLGTTDQSGAQKSFDMEILENLRRMPELLNAKQGVDVRATIEKKFGADEAVLSMFKQPKEQEQFITKTTIDNYIKTIEAANIVQRVNVLTLYKASMLRQGQFEPLLAKAAERLRNENAVNPDYTSDKANVVKALGLLVERFHAELKSYEQTVGELHAALIQAYDGASNWENQTLLIIELWRVVFDVVKEEQRESMRRVREFFSGKPEQGVIQAIDYWEESRGQNLLWNIVDSLFPRMLSEEHLLSFVYNLANDATRSKILMHLIDDTPLDNTYDIRFIKTLDKLPDRTELLKQLLLRVGKFTYHQKPPYYEFIGEKLGMRDPREIKDLAIEQIESLLMRDEAEVATVGFDFLEQAKFLGTTDRREMAKKVLGWLREPGKAIDSRHRLAVKTVALVFKDLQQPPQAEFVYLLFNLISPTQDHETIQMAIETLKDIVSAFGTYEKDYEDLLNRLQNWPAESPKDNYIEALEGLKSPKPGAREKKYWSTLQGLKTS